MNLHIAIEPSSLPSTASSINIKPRIIIHGGAGHITRENLTPTAYTQYRNSLITILKSASALLASPNATALDTATHTVSLLEDDPLFNAGRGAVFTRTGTQELESSIMITNGYRKRGVGCMLLSHVKNPVKLAREVLVRGEQEGGGGAQGHCQLSGAHAEKLAKEWGLEMVPKEYFFTRRRWQEHRRGLQSEREPSSPIARFDSLGSEERPMSETLWHGLNVTGIAAEQVREYLPQGTVGAVVLDRFGTVCVATSTGGLTNKLPGRIGDTPTLGAGFWAEEWVDEEGVRHAVGMSGTGNGDSFLRTSAVRTAAAVSRFSSPQISLEDAVARVAGPGGELQKSAGDRWGNTGEGEGGVIGIELAGSRGHVVANFNCGGMFRAWVDDDGIEKCMVFKEEY